jgi:transcriptional regulator with XRE-family HTH domain
MLNRSASERVRARLKALVDSQPRGFKKQIAEKLQVAPSTVTPWVAGEVDPPLDYLEAICQLAKHPIAELVAEDGSTLRELDADEAMIVRALRLWPLTVKRSLSAFLTFFADEPPPSRQSRKMHELWRHLNQRKRDELFGFAAHLSEGLPPDVTAKLFEELSAESKAAVGTGEPKRRRTP